MIRSHHLRRLLALLIVFTLVAAACGDDDDDTSSGDDTASADGSSGDDTTTADDGAEDDSSADDGSDDGSDDGEGDDAGDDGEGDGDDGGDDGAAAPAPGYGGEISFALEAETDGWLTPGQQCAVSCHTVMRSIYDPLMTEGPDGLAVPYLLESLEPLNDDLTEWEATLREGITFHDGTPADAEALKRFFDENKAGSILGLVLRDYEESEVTGPLSVKSTFSQPQGNLPDALTGQLGYLTAPSQFDDPDGSSNPVGTGPFSFVSWSPGEELVVERNENYWRSDADGNQLPYLDKITFRPIVSPTDRRAAMESGDVDVNHDSFGENYLFWTEDWDGNVVLDPVFHETTYLLVNNDDEAMGDVRVRRAMALCLDRDLYQVLRRYDGAPKANGPFAPGTVGYLEDTGFPEFDPEAGTALVDEVAAELGAFPTISYATTNNQSNLTTAEFITGQWKDNCGIDATIDQVEQAAFIGLALSGTFQVFLWRNHGAPNPANERIWWSEDFTEGLATNFGRIRNPEMDAALNELRAVADPTEAVASAEEVSRIFGDQVHNVWLGWTEWAIPSQSDVYGVGPVTMPDSGEHGLDSVAGRVFLTEAYQAG